MRRPFRRKRLEKWLRMSMDSATLLGFSRDDGNELLVEAKRRLDAGELDEAGRLFTLHLHCFGFNADGFLGLGAFHQALGDVDQAVHAYEKALSLREDDPFALTNILECHLLAGESPVGVLASLEALNPSAIPAELAGRIAGLKAIAKARRERDEEGGTPGLSSDVVSVNEDRQPSFDLEPKLSVAEFVDLLQRSTLAERRPIAEPETAPGMLANADLIVTARVGERLVGVSRAVTDFHFCTYLSDLAVDRAYQRRGIGRELIRRTHEAAGLKTTLILLAAPAARQYDPHIGMAGHDSCWIIPRSPHE